MLRRIAIIFGVIMLVIGILGFVPQMMNGDLLFGLFRVNDIHNFIHILTGLIAIICGLTCNNYAARLFFQIFGVVYALIALLGFFYMNEPLFGIIAHNMADTFLHILIAALSLYLGFGFVDRCCIDHDHDHDHHDHDVTSTKNL